MTALLPLITSVAGFFIKERRVQSKKRRGSRGGLLPSLASKQASTHSTLLSSTLHSHHMSENHGLLMPGPQDEQEGGKRLETELRAMEGYADGAQVGDQHGEAQEWARGEAPRGPEAERGAEGTGGGRGGRVQQQKR